MGRKVSDGKAFNVVIPAGAYADGELVRVGGLNGFLIRSVESTDTDRNRAIESDVNAIHSIAVPSGVNPTAGSFLYWTTPGSFQYGPTHLLAAPAADGAAPCFFVTGAKVAGVLRGRVLNGVGGDTVEDE